MSEKQLLTSMLLIHINEFLKYMEFIKTFYPIDKKK